MDIMEIKMGKEVKVSLFADDIALCITTPLENFHS